MRKDYTKAEIIRALEATLSIKAASRYLGCSYQHLRKWMVHYSSETHENLFEQYKNIGGKGIPKFNSTKTAPKLLDLLEGRMDIANYNRDTIKYRLVEEGFLEEKCYNCGFCERRVLDYKMPLIIHFKDGNKRNWKLENIEFSCYNCYFLFYGEVLNEHDIEALESVTATKKNSDLVDMELSDYHLERLEKLGLDDIINEYYDDEDDEEDDDYDIIAYKK